MPAAMVFFLIISLGEISVSSWAKLIYMLIGMFIFIYRNEYLDIINMPARKQKWMKRLLNTHVFLFKWILIVTSVVLVITISAAMLFNFK